MSQAELIAKLRKAVAADPQKDSIQSLRLFGSFLHGDATKDSDVDILFEPRKRIGYFALFGIQHRLSDRIGRSVELFTEEELSKYFRDTVVNEAEIIYMSVRNSSLLSSACRKID